MNGFEYFKLALSRYSDFEGRSRRSEYWYFSLFYVVSMVLVSSFFGRFGIFLMMFVCVLGFIPSLAVTIRRLHDIGKSGWYYLITFIPLIGTILVLVWMCTDSESGGNEWGSNPKEVHEEVFDHLIDDDSLV
jgi:uncharacterized membrane protein YhaH (DUF805 family)